MKRNQPSASDSEAMDERVRRSKEAVLAATNELLSEVGFGGVSVDAVSRRSGVAKTTIYRHWPSRSALLVDACSKLGSRLKAPETGSFKGDLEALALAFAGRLQTARWTSILPSIIDAAERDPELADIYARLQTQLVSAWRSVIESARERGELPPEADTSHIIASIVGPLVYRRWFSREALDEPFVHRIVTNAVDSFAQKQ